MEHSDLSCCDTGECMATTCAGNPCDEGYDCVEEELQCPEGEYCPQFLCNVNCDTISTTCNEGEEWNEDSFGMTCGWCMAVSCAAEPCSSGYTCQDRDDGESSDCIEGAACAMYDCVPVVDESTLCFYQSSAVSLGAVLIMDDGCTSCQCTQDSISDLACVDLGCTTLTPTTDT